MNRYDKLKAMQQERDVESRDLPELLIEPPSPATIKLSSGLKKNLFQNSAMKLMIDTLNQLRDEGDAAVVAVSNAANTSADLQQDEENDQNEDLVNDQTVGDTAKMSTSKNTNATKQTARYAKSALTAGGNAVNKRRSKMDIRRSARDTLRTLEENDLM